MINFQWYKFSELSVELLYSVLALRANVFIVEQNRVCLDPDGKDIYAFHLLGIEDGVLAAYLRLIPPTDIENYILFGRVVTSRITRTKGHGKLLMQELLNYCGNNFPSVSIMVSVKISPPFNSFISSNKVSKLLTLLIRILINGYSRSIARNSI